MKIHLTSILERMEGNWCIYHCQIEDKEGNLRDGTIQSDGHVHDEGTIDYDDE